MSVFKTCKWNWVWHISRIYIHEYNFWEISLKNENSKFDTGLNATSRKKQHVGIGRLLKGTPSTHQRGNTQRTKQYSSLPTWLLVCLKNAMRQHMGRRIQTIPNKNGLLVGYLPQSDDKLYISLETFPNWSCGLPLIVI